MSKVGSGIYMLRWPNREEYYIGGSVDIDCRYSCHLTNLRYAYHTNKRMIELTKEFGEPYLTVILLCKRSELFDRETDQLEKAKHDPNCINKTFLATGYNNKKTTTPYPVSLTPIQMKRLRQKAKEAGMKLPDFLIRTFDLDRE